MTHYRLNPAALFCIGLAMLGLGLTYWQLSRAAFKEQQLARATQNGTTTGAAKLPALGSAERPWSQEESAQALDQKTYWLQGGQWIAGGQIFLDNRALNGRAGVHVLSPARFEDGSIAWVNRGWAPKLPGSQGPAAEPFIQAAAHPPAPASLQEGFEVVAHQSLMRRVELTDNSEVLRQGSLWQNFDSQAAHDLLSRLLPGEQLRVWPVIFWRTSPSKDGLIQQPPKILQDDIAKHYGYAFQWVLLTLVALFFAWKLSRRTQSLELE